MSTQTIYLEDNRPVRTITISGLKENSKSVRKELYAMFRTEINKNIDAIWQTAEYLRGYFECAAGPVQNVEIVESTINHERVVNVTFVLPEDAAKIIHDRSLHCHFKIDQADPNYQPQIDPNSLRLEQINGHCLLKIISFLDFADTVNLAKSCPLLKSVTQKSYRSQKTLSIGDSPINKRLLRAQLKRTGRYIRTIKIHKIQRGTLELLSKYCRKITKMVITGITVKRKMGGGVVSDDFKKNKILFKNLKVLIMENNELCDSILKEICRYKKLTEIEFNECKRITGKSLTNLRKLKILKAFNCRRLEEANLRNCMDNNDLKSFATDLF